MKYTIDTVNKTIEIEEATTKELKKLCKNYEGFTITSKLIWNNNPFVYTTFDGTVTYTDFTTSVDCAYQGTFLPDISTTFTIN